jgi:hypothetical protein
LITIRSLEALRAALLLGAACAVDGRLRYLLALPLVVCALLQACRALRPAIANSWTSVPHSLWACVAAMSALGAVAGGSGPLWYEVLRRGFGLFGVVVVGFVSGGDPVLKRRALAAAIGSGTLLYLITPAVVTQPQIDVVPWTDTAVRALLNGVHPYTVQAPDVYGGARDFGFVVRVYPYMPATLLAFAPFVALFGDFRYALAACLPMTVWLVRRIGTRRGVDDGLVDAATLTIVFNPIGSSVVRSGWDEPLLCALAAAFTLAAVLERPRATTTFLFLMPALKQYALAPPLLWIPVVARRAQWGAVAIGAAVALATAAPFLVWNPDATLAGMVFQMRAPTRPRLTAISIPGLLANIADWNLPIWMAPLAELTTSVALVAFGLVADVSAVLIGSAIALLMTFLLGWQAFVNYYVFIGTLLALAAVADRGARKAV